MKTLEELKKEIHYVYSSAAEAESASSLSDTKMYLMGSLEQVGKILEGIIDELIRIKEQENKIEQLEEKIQQLEKTIEELSIDPEEEFLKNYKAY